MCEPTKYALLVGVNFYIPGGPPDNNDNLDCCVGDIGKADAYCLKQGMERKNIIKLTSTDAGNWPEVTEPTEAEKDRATYSNIIKALEFLIGKTTCKGDHVLVQYSGHGARTPDGHKTMYPFKGAEAKDESLCPADCDEPEGGYITDVMLAYYFNAMVEKGLKLTVVLDCCHSGGATRGPEVRKNKAKLRFHTPKPKASSDEKGTVNKPKDIPLDKLEEAWKKQQNRGPGKIRQGALVNPSGYQLFAACRAHEGAWELPGMGGYLTHFLTQALKENPHATQSMLWRKIDDGIQEEIREMNEEERRSGGTRWFEQVAMLEGDNCITYFHQSESGVEDTPVTRVRCLDAKKVELRAGAAHGVCEGDVYRIYPWDARDLTDQKACIAEVTVTGVAPLKSQAVYRNGSIAAGTTGCQALLQEKAPGAQLNIQGEHSKEDLAHLTRFKSSLDLTNTGECPSLRGLFTLSCNGLELENGCYNVKDGTEVEFSMKSTAKSCVYAAAFGFTNSLGVIQLYPVNSPWEAMYEQDERIFVLPMCVPDGQDSSIDCVKVFITNQPTSFKTLEMPSIELSSGGNLCSAWASDWTKAKEPKQSSTAASGSGPNAARSEEWETLQITIRTTR